MTNNNTNSNDDKLITALELDEMSDEQRAQFLLELGDTMSDSAILRWLSTFDEQQIKRIKDELALEKVQSQGTLTYLLQNYPEFKTILEEEMKAMRRELQFITSS